MSTIEFEVKYHSIKMLKTLDLHYLVSTLVEKYDGNVQLHLVQMNEEEKIECTSLVFGWNKISPVFWLSERDNQGNLSRRTDLEKEILDFGQK